MFYKRVLQLAEVSSREIFHETDCKYHFDKEYNSKVDHWRQRDKWQSSSQNIHSLVGKADQ